MFAYDAQTSIQIANMEFHSSLTKKKITDENIIFLFNRFVFCGHYSL